MNEEIYLSQEELSKRTGIPFYSINYLVRLEEVTVIRRGRGRPRQFPLKAVQQIENWKKYGRTANKISE